MYNDKHVLQLCVRESVLLFSSKGVAVAGLTNMSTPLLPVID